MNTTFKTQPKEKSKLWNSNKTRSLTVIAMLSALATILMLFELPLWFAPPFYKLDFSEVPVFIGAFAMGPVAGMIIELIKVLINLVINGTETAFIGELANFLIGCSLVVPAAILYKRKKSVKSALVGLTAGTLGMVILGSVLNAFVLLPVYGYFYGMPMEALIGMGTEVNASITDLSTFVLYAVAPFNLLKGVVVSVITLLLYKRLSVIIKTFTK